MRQKELYPFWHKIGDCEFSLEGGIYPDEIGFVSFTQSCPICVLNSLKEAEGKDILIHVDSPGGDQFTGVSIAYAVKSYPGKVTVRVKPYGSAASAASFLLLAADEIEMYPSSHVLLHPARVQVYATGDVLIKMGTLLKENDKQTILDFVRHLRDPALKDELQKAFYEERNLSAEEVSRCFDVKILEEKSTGAEAGETL